MLEWVTLPTRPRIQVPAMSSSMSNPYQNTDTTSGSAGGQVRAWKLRRIDPLSAGKVLGFLYVLVGLIVGVVMVLLALLSGEGGAMAGGLLMGVLVPVLYGIGGFVGGAVGALFYNLCSSIVGGIKMEFEQ